MDYKRQVYLIISLAEIWFCLFGIFGPGTNSAWGFFIESVASFPGFLVIALMLSSTALAMYFTRRHHHATIIISALLTSQWATLCLTPLLTGFITITYPLFIMAFALRLITTISIESEVRANGV